MVASALAAGALLLAVPPAGAAVTIGSDLDDLPDATLPGTFTYAHDELPGGRLVASPIDGVVVRWRIRSETEDGIARLRVLRPTSGGAFIGAGTSATRTASGSGIDSFAARLPIRSGDHIGADQLTEETLWYVAPVSGASIVGWDSVLPDLVTGSPTTTIDGELLLNADVEQDADADGFGDETQDDCLGQPGPRNGCETVPPETTIVKGPKGKLKTRKRKKRVRFKFVSSEPDSKFRCVVDDGLGEACRSPYRHRFRRGRHDFEVQAIDSAGNADPTPATLDFKLKRKHKRKNKR
ncbi:MAG: hypothetical protein ACRDL3_01725 [Solirubrobacterales bacterium]